MKSLLYCFDGLVVRVNEFILCRHSIRILAAAVRVFPVASTISINENLRGKDAVDRIGRPNKSGVAECVRGHAENCFHVDHTISRKWPVPIGRTVENVTPVRSYLTPVRHTISYCHGVRSWAGGKGGSMPP